MDGAGMTDPTDRAALTTLIAAAISHCEREIAEMNRAVRMLEKAEQGIWPTKTPLGYRNVAAWGAKEVLRGRPHWASGYRRARRGPGAGTAVARPH